MPNTAPIILFFAGALLACNGSTDKDSSAPSYSSGTAAEQRDRVMTATSEAVESVRDYVYAEKSEFMVAANRELSETQAEVERLRAVVERSSGATRADAEAKLKEVSDKWAAAKLQLDGAEAATEAGWEDVQRRYRTAQRDLKSTFDHVRSWLSERIDP